MDAFLEEMLHGEVFLLQYFAELGWLISGFVGDSQELKRGESFF